MTTQLQVRGHVRQKKQGNVVREHTTRGKKEKAETKKGRCSGIISQGKETSLREKVFPTKSTSQDDTFANLLFFWFRRRLIHGPRLP